MKRTTLHDKHDPLDGPALSEARSRLLRETSETIGASWMLDYSTAVELSGRRVEGGWPGTLPEARGRVLARLPQELSARGAPPLSAEELAVAVSLASAEAKRRWQLATKKQFSRSGRGLNS